MRILKRLLLVLVVTEQCQAGKHHTVLTSILPPQIINEQSEIVLLDDSKTPSKQERPDQKPMALAPAEVVPEHILPRPAQTGPWNSRLQSQSPKNISTLRSLADWTLEDFVLVSTVDGALQARDRETGAIRWTLPNEPLIQIDQIRGIANSEPVWIAEPSEDGGLLYFNMDSGVERVPLSVRALVERAPYALFGNIIYTGGKRTLMYSINSVTGELEDIYGLPTGSPEHMRHGFSGDFGPPSTKTDEQEALRGTLPNENTAITPTPIQTSSFGSSEAASVLMIGRTEYTLEIHDESTSSAWRLKYASWKPNSRDLDLQAQYSGPPDGKYFIPASNDTIIAMLPSNIALKHWAENTSSTAVTTFDVMRQMNPVDSSPLYANQARKTNYLTIFPQPAAHISSLQFTTADDIFIGSTTEGGFYALSGSRYFILLSSTASAKWCLGAPRIARSNDEISNLLVGVHPSWCQYSFPQLKAPEPEHPEQTIEIPVSWSTPPAPPIYPQLPSYIAWLSLTYRIAENLIAFLVLALVYLFASSRGWITFGEKQSKEVSSKNLKESDAASVKTEATDTEHDNTTSPDNVDSNLTEPPEQMRWSSHNSTRTRELEASPFTPSKPGFLKDKHLHSAPITITDEVLGLGSHGTVVFKGKFQNRDVAVKRMLLNFYDVASQEIELLQESDDHPNVVRYFCKNMTDEFLYVALELCQCTIEDVIQGRPSGSRTPAQEVQIQVLQQQLNSKDALYQICLGVQHLHSLKVVHCDIKPQNILISQPRPRSKSHHADPPIRLLISDFGLCKKLEGDQSSYQATAASTAGTAGWAAPEIAMHGNPPLELDEGKNSELVSHKPNTSGKTNASPRLTRAVDIFSLGCVFYYVLSRGSHPFGENFERQSNIQQQKFDLSALDATPDREVAIDLIKQMLSRNPLKRPTIAAVLRHPFFWSSQEKLDFLVRVSDRLEHDTREEVRTPLLTSLERCSARVLGSDWHTRFPAAYVNNLGKYRKYHGDRVIDLLRAFRNKLHHYNDYSPEMKALVGPVPEGYLKFYSDKFPLLLIEVYRFVRREISQEDAFSPFFTNPANPASALPRKL